MPRRRWRRELAGDPHRRTPRTSDGPRVQPVVTATVILWFTGVVAAHYAGLLRAGAGNLPVPLGVAIVVPIAIFLASYWAVPRFRAAVLGVDLRLVTSFQAWPAGFGDVAVGLAAPWVVWRVIKDGSYATTRGFAAFHWLGLLDVASALGTFTITSGIISGLTNPTSVVMEEMPLLLIPGFLVPAFVILHAVALLKARALRQALRSH